MMVFADQDGLGLFHSIQEVREGALLNANYSLNRHIVLIFQGQFAMSQIKPNVKTDSIKDP